MQKYHNLTNQINQLNGKSGLLMKKSSELEKRN